MTKSTFELISKYDLCVALERDGMILGLMKMNEEKAIELYIHNKDKCGPQKTKDNYTHFYIRSKNCFYLKSDSVNYLLFLLNL